MSALYNTTLQEDVTFFIYSWTLSRALALGQLFSDQSGPPAKKVAHPCCIVLFGVIFII